MRRAILPSAVVALACSGCAAAKSPPSSAPGGQSYGQSGYPSGATGTSQDAQYAQPPPAPPPPAPVAPSAEYAPSSSPPSSSTPSAAKPAQPGGAGGASSSRSAAVQSASRDVEASQRELDVAGSDCRNACRALGSMDRAAGRLCELSQGDGEPQRCDDARRRVYSARDRVKTTCGTCADGTTVEHAAPIPSRR
jgi:hypothetical protein